MKGNYLFFGIFVSMAGIISSCSSPRFAYSPSAHNAPVLTKKGDNKIGGFYSTNITSEGKQNNVIVDNRSRGFDLQGAYAVTNHFAVQASYFYRWEQTTGGPDSSTILYNRNLTEAGIGYYVPVSDNNKIFFQIFGGAGLGKFSFTDVSRVGNYFHQANITKIYLQPAILFKSKGSFTSAISLRASNIQYSKVKTNYKGSQLDDFKLDSLTNRSKYFFEPAFMFSFGFKNVPGLRLEFQGGTSFLLSRHFIDYRFFNLSAGIWCDIGAFFRKNKE